MAVYYCHSCGTYVDDDWHPGVEPNVPEDHDAARFMGDLMCPSCCEDFGLDEDGEPYLDDDDGQPSERTEWRDFDPYC